MIKTKQPQLEQMIEATCDSCGNQIPIQFGNLADHLRIGGHHNGKLLDGIVCIKCMEEKLGFIKIQRNTNTIGYC